MLDLSLSLSMMVGTEGTTIQNWFILSFEVAPAQMEFLSEERVAL